MREVTPSNLVGGNSDSRLPADEILRTAILVTRTIVIFREQNLVGVDDRGRFGALSFRRRYSLHQHDLAGIKRTGEIFTQRLSLRRRKFNNLGDLLGDRHAICCNCFNQRSPHHVLFRFIVASEKVTERLKENIMSRKRFIRKGAPFPNRKCYGEIPVSSEIFLCRSPFWSPVTKASTFSRVSFEVLSSIKYTFISFQYACYASFQLSVISQRGNLC